MAPTILDMHDPVANDIARKTPIGGFPSIASLPGKQANNLSAMSANPWGKSIWGSNNLSSFPQSSKHLQLDTTTATKFQKTGSGLLVESSTTDDWSAGLKTTECAEIPRPPNTSRFNEGPFPGTTNPTNDMTAASSGRSSTLSSVNVDDTPRPPYTSSFTNLSGTRLNARPGSSSSGLAKPNIGQESSSWTNEHYSHSPVDDLPYHSNGSAHSIPSSLPASQTSEEVSFDVFQNSRISPDSARLIGSSHSSRHSNVPSEQQLAMQFGQMGFGPGLDTSFPTTQARSPFASGPLSSGQNVTRYNTFPDTHNGPYADFESDLMSGQSQPYTPFGASFFPGMATHSSIADMGFSDYRDARPASSSSSLGRDARRDSAQGREIQMLCGPRSAGSDFQAQSRMRQQQQQQHQQGYRQLSPDMRTMPYYNTMAMRGMPGSAFPVTPNSYHTALATYGQMPNSGMMTSPNFMPKMPAHFDQGQAYRSLLLNEYKSNARTSKRLELREIYGHVVEFSGDQHGSRFIQSKLEGASSDEKERIVQEIEPNAMQLMTDVFGNYVIQKLFEHGDQTQKRLLANKMKGQVFTLSTQMYGCRVVQKALQHILTDQQAAIIRELDQAQDILRCVKDQNGNHVIQRAIERCQPDTTNYILAAFRGQIMHLSSHAYGCRVIQRCLEYCGPEDKSAIMAELHEGFASLVSDQYGNYVVQHVVEHGSPADRAAVLEIVRKDLGNFSKHKFASNVVEKCLESADEQWRSAVIHKLVEVVRHDGDSMLLDLIKDSYGNYVIQKLLDVMSPEDYTMFLDRLHPELNKAKRAGQGKQVQSIERKMEQRMGASAGTSRSATSSNLASRHQSGCVTPAIMTAKDSYMVANSIAGAIATN